MTTVAFFDVPAGVAGDMLLGALLDAGLALDDLREVVDALGLEGVTLSAARVRRGPLAATKVEVLVHGRPADGAPDEDGPQPAHHADHDHDHRTLAEVEAIVRRGAGRLPGDGLDDAIRAFRLLAEAEARVHGTTVEEVRFHEVGALDALVDVVGTCVGLRRLGVTEVRVGPLPFGAGEVRTAHGALPLPAPAVVHLLAGQAVVPSDERHEQVTPTGAALVRALSRGSRVPAGFVPRRVGAGAGTFAGGRLPNVVRLVLGETEDGETPTDAVLLETNLDDATGQEAARAIDVALAAGALDAWAVPCTMKKGRPGLVLSVLATPADAPRLEAVLFRETPTLGVRRRAVARTVLVRRFVPVTTPYGEVRVKVREAPDGAEGTPEHDDCLALAERHGVPLRRVLDAARAAFAARAED